MLPKCKPAILTKSSLTDEVVNTALDRCEYPTITTTAARNACYTWLSRSLVWDDDLDAISKELSMDPSSQGMEVLSIIQEIAAEIQDVLVAEEIARYGKKHLTGKATANSIKSAMRRTGIDVDVGDMKGLLAAYAVGGVGELEKNYQAFLDGYHITSDNVKQIAVLFQSPNRPITYGYLHRDVLASVQKDPLWGRPELEYVSLSTDADKPVGTYHIDITAEVKYGSNEGTVCLISAQNGPKKIYFAIMKSLSTGKETWMELSRLGGLYSFYANEFIGEHINDLEPSPLQ